MSRVEGYHAWGCGALNGTAPCSCGDGLTVEEIDRQAEHMREPGLKYQAELRKKGIGLTMTESLARLDEIARKIRNQI